jgi:hypothetical protein
MKKITITFMIMTLTLSSAHALKLCQLEWQDAWKNASGTLSASSYKYTQSWTAGAPGTWAVTSDQGSTGVKHTISGVATCSNSETSATSLDTSTAENNNLTHNSALSIPIPAYAGMTNNFVVCQKKNATQFYSTHFFLQNPSGFCHSRVGGIRVYFIETWKLTRDFRVAVTN